MTTWKNSAFEKEKNDSGRTGKKVIVAKTVIKCDDKIISHIKFSTKSDEICAALYFFSTRIELDEVQEPNFLN